MWERAWPLADVEAVVALYADDAIFRSEPFRDLERPGDYVAWAFGQQASAECRFGEPIVDGERAAVDWWAVVTAKDGGVESLAGVSLLRFDVSGRVVEQCDTWSSAPSGRDAPGWAGPR